MKDKLIAATKDFDSDKLLLFYNPILTLSSHNLNDVIPILSEVENEVNNGKWAAGFVSYEASAAFDSALETKDDPKFPKICFSIFEKNIKTDISEIEDIHSDGFYLGAWRSELTHNEYVHAVNNIRQQILYGNSYQANFTFKLESAFDGSAFSAFMALLKNQNTSYNTYYDFGDFSVCSASPELFFEREGNLITCKPMKGTAARLEALEEDSLQAKNLRYSEKDQAENIMIVDLIRNDLSKIAHDCTVKTKSVFDLQSTKTVWQMTSTVCANSTCSNSKLWQALFPCASITGAPKAKTMQILRNAEKSPRRVYTGGLCIYSPERKNKLRCSVPIRTILIDKLHKKASYFIGSGITYESNATKEYEECLLKAKALPDKASHFCLLESILLDLENGYFLLDQHLQRLSKSAEFFNFPCHTQQVKRLLNDFLSVNNNINRNSKYKIRVILNNLGQTKIESSQLENYDKVFRLKMAESPIDSESIFVKHKTTNRKIYDNLMQRDCDDTIFFNYNNHITESSIGNIAYMLDNKWYTPPVGNGLLAGIFRQHLLDSHQITEKQISKDQIFNVQQIAIINSVRGWINAELM